MSSVHDDGDGGAQIHKGRSEVWVGQEFEFGQEFYGRGKVPYGRCKWNWEQGCDTDGTSSTRKGHLRATDGVFSPRPSSWGTLSSRGRDTPTTNGRTTGGRTRSKSRSTSVSSGALTRIGFPTLSGLGVRSDPLSRTLEVGVTR